MEIENVIVADKNQYTIKKLMESEKKQQRRSRQQKNQRHCKVFRCVRLSSKYIFEDQIHKVEGN